MTKNELKAKYARIASDPSQLEMFKDDVIDGTTTCLPELPEGAEEKTLTLTMVNGVPEWSEGGVGPTPEPVAKGDIIFFGGHRYRVLEAESQDAVKVMLMDDCIASKFNDNDTKVDFDVDGTTVQGQKYADSALEAACLNFVESLPQDIQDAIIAEEVEQDMYEISDTATGDYVEFIRQDGSVYRLKKLATVTVGSGLAHAISISEIIAYLAENLRWDALNQMMFDYDNPISISAWTMSARSSYSSHACSVFGIDGYFNYDYFYILCVARPAFKINLQSVSYIK